MAASKSRNTRMPLVPGGASKCLRYIHSCSQAPGAQFCHDKGATVCGRVTVANALSSNPGSLACGDAGPKIQPVLNGTVLAVLLNAAAIAAPARGLTAATALAGAPVA